MDFIPVGLSTQNILDKLIAFTDHIEELEEILKKRRSDIEGLKGLPCDHADGRFLFDGQGDDRLWMITIVQSCIQDVTEIHSRIKL
jgi:hypothetical protein